MSEKTRIAVTELEYDKAPAVFEKAAEAGLICLSAPKEETELASFIRTENIQHAILGVEQYRGPLYEALPKRAVIARFGVGYDAIDLGKASAEGIFCVNTPGALEESVAEYTITLMLAAARHVPIQDASVRNGQWQAHLGTELRGKRLTLVGCGYIGRTVARTAAEGFGMDVIGCEVRHVDIEMMKREYGFSAIYRDFTTAVGKADFVSLHIPSTPATRHFINEKRLALIPSTAWLINTARGAVVSESALYDALSSGRLKGAALDVFESEPYVPVADGKDLRSLDNTIMTPHVASSTQEACDRVAERALSNIVLAGRGEYENMDLLNPEVLLEKGKG